MIWYKTNIESNERFVAQNDSHRKRVKMKTSDPIKTTIKILTKFNKVQLKLEKMNKDFRDSDNYNSAARAVYFALACNGLLAEYTVNTRFLDFINRLVERKEAFGNHGYGISEAVKTYGKDIIFYIINTIQDAYRQPYTCTHDLDDLSLQDDDIERVCSRFLNEIKENCYGRYNELYKNWAIFINQMNI